MLVDIDKIIVGDDRIRKDFGDIEELAEDIKENGLINPPVVNKSYVLLAGERRLRACKLLGWPTIEVRMMDTRDAEHELNIEISENDVRKGFTKSERLDYIKRLYRIAQAKAAERHAANGGDRRSEVYRESARQNSDTPVSDTPTKERADEVVADAFGISRDTVRRELYIDEHRDLLDPSDFAEWDEGRLSTNKAYQRIKAAQKRAEQEREEAERERDAARRAAQRMQREVESMRKAMDERPEPEVIERVVEREVIPADYEDTKRSNDALMRDNERLNREYQEMWRKKQDVDRQLAKANELLGEKSRNNNAQRDIEMLTAATNTYLRQYGGKAWAFDQFDRVGGTAQREFKSAITNLAAFAQNLADMVNELGTA